MKIYISNEACPPLIDYLKSMGHTIEYTESDLVYPAISKHPDIYMCHLGNGLFVGQESSLGYSYPFNIIYNGASTGRYFIHNIKYTDKKLLEIVKKNHQKIINVKQGYAKCSIVVVDEKSIITSDRGIAKACDGILEVLLIENGHIVLEGFNYGFIGGCSGRIGNTVIFNGNLEDHPDFKKIIEFIEERDLEVKYFRDYPLTDIGSIIGNEGWM